jgi:hypothetical protein
MSVSQDFKEINISDVENDDHSPVGAGPSSTPSAQQDSSKPLSLGYSIEGLAKPGQFDNQPALPGINLNENMERSFKKTFNDMLDHFEKAESDAAEALAR